MWDFIKSSSTKENWYLHNKIEICFIGRSNVGKSTLINTLANKKIAKTSKTPGRTQLINYFDTNKGVIVVDLPGYGYAKISKLEQQKMFFMIDEYFNFRKPNIVFVLIDSKIGIQKQDERIINHLKELKHNVVLILTKCDKAKQSELSSTLKHHFFDQYIFFKTSFNNQKQINLLNNYIFNIKDNLN